MKVICILLFRVHRITVDIGEMERNYDHLFQADDTPGHTRRTRPRVEVDDIADAIQSITNGMTLPDSTKKSLANASNELARDLQRQLRTKAKLDRILEDIT